MPDRRAIVNPVKGKKPPDTGPLAIIAATETDLHLLSRLADTPMAERRKLYMPTGASSISRGSRTTSGDSRWPGR